MHKRSSRAVILALILMLGGAASTAFAISTLNFTSGIINSSGYIGIGTTTPGNALTVVGSPQIIPTTTGSAANTTFWINAPKDTISIFLGDGGSTSGYATSDYSSDIRFNGSAVAWGDLSYYPEAGGTTYGQFRFTADGATVQTQPNASIGVGGLYDNGVGNFTQPITVGTPTVGTQAATKAYVDTAVAGASTQWTTTSTGVFYNGGNVGIGTAAPGKTLTIISAGVASFFQAGNGGYSALSFTGDNSGTIGSMTTFNGYVLLGSQNAGGTGTNGEIGISSSTHNVILGGAALGSVSGNVGIGTNDPSLGGAVASKLTVETADASTAFAIGNSSGYRRFAMNPLSTGGWTLYDGTNASGTAWAPGITQVGGNVGIGDTAPVQKLDVDGSIELSSGGGTTIGGYVGTGAINTGSSTDLGLRGGPNGNVTIGVNGYEYMRVASSGDVGIGTTTPTYMLSVAGTGYFSQPVVVGTPTLATQAATKGYVDAAVAGGGQWTTTSTGVFYNSGNVGIGTVSPPDRLDVDGGFSKFQYNSAGVWPSTDALGGVVIAWNRSNGGAETDFYNVYSNAGTAFQFTQMTGASTGTNIMTLAGSGNVGIATTTPHFPLDIFTNSDAYGLSVGDYNNSDLRIAGTASGDNGYGLLQTFTNSSTPGGVLSLERSGGNVGIGTSTPGTAVDTNASYFRPDPSGEFADIYAASHEAVLDLASNQNTSGNQIGGIYFTRTAGQTDAHLQIAGIETRQNGSGITAGGDMYFFTKPNGSGTTTSSPEMIILNNGNVGVGLAAPTFKFEVSGDAGDAFYNTAGTAGIILYPNSNNIQLANSGANLTINNMTNLILNPSSYVGVGTTSPAYKLDVASGGSSTARFGTASTDVITVGNGAGKVTAGTFDPAYSIGGAGYATYLPGITGEKEETAGSVMLVPLAKGDFEAVLDFADAPQGSDLWLFRKVIDASDNFQYVSVILTPGFNGNAWYEKDAAQNQIVIHGNASGEVSYQLIGRRFDWQSWKNTTTDDGGLVVPTN